MARPDKHPAWEKIERDVEFDPSGTADYHSRPGEHEIELSKAISLKRIADAFTLSAKLPDSAIAVATGNAIADLIRRGIEAGLAAPLNQYGEGIGEAIQGQMIRGQRGIDQYERG